MALRFPTRVQRHLLRCSPTTRALQYSLSYLSPYTISPRRHQPHHHIDISAPLFCCHKLIIYSSNMQINPPRFVRFKLRFAQISTLKSLNTPCHPFLIFSLITSAWCPSDIFFPTFIAIDSLDSVHRLLGTSYYWNFHCVCSCPSTTCQTITKTTENNLCWTKARQQKLFRANQAEYPPKLIVSYLSPNSHAILIALSCPLSRHSLSLIQTYVYSFSIMS